MYNDSFWDTAGGHHLCDTLNRCLPDISELIKEMQNRKAQHAVTIADVELEALVTDMVNQEQKKIITISQLPGNKNLIVFSD